MSIKFDVELDKLKRMQRALEENADAMLAVSGKMCTAMNIARQGMEDSSADQVFQTIYECAEGLKSEASRSNFRAHSMERYITLLEGSDDYFQQHFCHESIKVNATEVMEFDSFLQKTIQVVNEGIQRGIGAFCAKAAYCEGGIYQAEEKIASAEAELAQAEAKYAAAEYVDVFDPLTGRWYKERVASNPYAGAVSSAAGGLSAAKKEKEFWVCKKDKVTVAQRGWENKQKDLLSEYEYLLKKSNSFVSWYYDALSKIDFEI